MTRIPRTEPYPPVLRQEIRRAARLSHALSLLAARLGTSDASFEWLSLRVDEVRTRVGHVTHAWSEDRLETAEAADRLRDHLRGLEEALYAFTRSSFVRGAEDTTSVFVHRPDV
jgi:hypothetical protein